MEEGTVDLNLGNEADILFFWVHEKMKPLNKNLTNNCISE
jgi:hypothetical protein